MTVVGAAGAGQTIPNSAIPSSIARAASPLRSTPPVFTAISARESNQDFAIRAIQAIELLQTVRGTRLVKGFGNAPKKFGEITLPLALDFSVTGRATNNGITLPLEIDFSTSGAVTAGAVYPSLLFDVAFQNQPLTLSPTWTDASPRLRDLVCKRGRSYEFDRMETGTASAALSNRDAALSPANSASPYAPLVSTRPVRVQAVWNGTTYPLFRGITEGYPQAYPGLGKDAVVAQQASDMFYALNNSRFTPGTTSLITSLTMVAADTVQTITVGSTALPMPQVVPFEIVIDGGELIEETMTVTAIVSSTQYTVLRDSETPYAHTGGDPTVLYGGGTMGEGMYGGSGGAVVTTHTVSFGEAVSGTRIQQVLEAVGFSSSWYDLDAGQSVMTASEDLAEVSPLEHINLITEAEFGRFFVSRSGLFTFRDRHAIILDFLDPVLTFVDYTLLSGPNEVTYRIEAALEHSEEKLYNRVRITIPSGEIIDVSDEASIDEHFERVFEKQYPYANRNDAVSAAHFVLVRQSEHTLRLPQLVVHPANDPSAYWPLVLAREIGDRCRFRYQPEGGGDEIDQDVIIEGISHAIRPKAHSVAFQCTEADPNEYWILGTAGYSELGETTWAAF